jgi:hypothetical protein
MENLTIFLIYYIIIEIGRTCSRYRREEMSVLDFSGET